MSITTSRRTRPITIHWPMKCIRISFSTSVNLTYSNTTWKSSALFVWAITSICCFTARMRGSLLKKPSPPITNFTLIKNTPALQISTAITLPTYSNAATISALICVKSNELIASGIISVAMAAVTYGDHVFNVNLLNHRLIYGPVSNTSR